MHKSLITTIAAFTTAVLFTVTATNAATYKFSFQSNDAELTATGEITVDAADQVTGVSGIISGLVNETISAVAAIADIMYETARMVDRNIRKLLVYRDFIRELYMGFPSPIRLIV